MSPRPTLLLKPDGSRDAGGIITPTLTGGVITVPGQYGPAWQVAEATTNLALNPRGAVDTTGTSSEIPAAIATDPGLAAASGTALSSCFEVTSNNQLYDGFSSLGMGEWGSPTPPRTFTASMWVKFPTGFNFVVLARVFTNGYTTAKDAQQLYVGTGNWQYVEATVTTLNNDVANEARGIAATKWGSDGDGGSITYYVSLMQVEEKPYATPYADGSLGAGHAWTGTAHASPSTRAATNILAQHTMDMANGTMLIRFKIAENPVLWPSYATLLHAGHYGAGYDRITTYLYQGGMFANFDRETIQHVIPIPGVTPDVPHTFVQTWTPNLFRAGVDGQMGETYKNAPIGSWGDQTLALGNIGFNGLIESVLIFDRALTDTEITRIMDYPGAWDWQHLMPKVGGIQWSVPESSIAVSLSVPNRAEVPLMTERTLLLSPDGSFDRDGAVTPTLTGGVITVPGEYGPAWQVAEATTNLHTDPAFNAAIGTHWRTGGSIGAAVTSTKDTTRRPDGLPAHVNSLQQVVNTGSSMDLTIWDTSSTNVNLAVAPHTLSIFVYHEIGTTISVTLHLQGWTSGFAAMLLNVSQAWSVPSGEWTRISITVTPSTAGSVHNYGWVAASGRSPGDTIWISAGQVEEKPYATPYADGSLGAGHAWTGTAHASVSTRAASSIDTTTAGRLTNDYGTILMRVTPRYGKPVDPKYQTPFTITGAGSNVSSFIVDWDSGNEMYMYISNAATTPIATQGLWKITPTFPDDGHPATLVYRWSPDAFGFTFTGASGWSIASRTVYNAADTIAPNLRIGSPNAGSPWNGTIESVLIFDRALLPEEITRLMAIPGPWTNETSAAYALMQGIGGVQFSHPGNG